MFKRIRQSELGKDEINMRDIQNICLEIAYHDPKSHRMFNKGKIKSKYTRRISKMVEELDKAMSTGNLEKVNRVFEKYDGIIERYTKLNPNMSIKMNSQGNKEFIEFEETKGRGSISALKMLYTTAKQNTREQIEFENKMKVKAKEDEKLEAFFEELDEKEQQKIIEANVREESERFSNAMDNAYMMSEFKKDLESKVRKYDEEVEQRYGDESARYREQQKNPYRKQLDELNDNNKGLY